MLTEEQLHEIEQFALAAQQDPPIERFLVLPAEQVLELLAILREREAKIKDLEEYARALVKGDW